MVAYFQSARSSGLTAQQSWKRYARIIFSLHATAVAGIFLTLFYIIFQHYFEYHYAWSHSSKELPFKYLLSCFWEGQEGSFLLWTIWNGILGWVAMRSAGKWEAPVMSILTAVQVFLASMLLGLYFFNQPVGSDPFILLRERMTGAPIFQLGWHLFRY